MTLLVDGIIFSLQRHGGISVYFRELLQRLTRDDIPTVLTLEGRLQQEPPRVDGAVTVLRRLARPLERYRQCIVPPGTTPTVFHSSYYRQPARTTLPTVVTVHDFNYERLSSGPRRWVHSAQKFAAIRAAQVVVCVSRSTLDDLHQVVGLRPGQRAQVILNGVSKVFQPLALPPPVRPFMLFVGQRSGYKNFALALRSLAFLPDMDLLCVGGGPLKLAELAKVSDAVRRRVRHAGHVDDAALNRLYNQAQCLVYPSRYEGFGIPVAEAMRAGCPVVSIDCKAIREIGGDALTIAEDEPRALADGILRTLESAYRAAVVARGRNIATRYSWESNYRATLEVYRELSGADLGGMQGSHPCAEADLGVCRT